MPRLTLEEAFVSAGQLYAVENPNQNYILVATQNAVVRLSIPARRIQTGCPIENHTETEQRKMNQLTAYRQSGYTS